MLGNNVGECIWRVGVEFVGALARFQLAQKTILLAPSTYVLELWQWVHVSKLAYFTVIISKTHVYKILTAVHKYFARNWSFSWLKSIYLEQITIIYKYFG